MQETPLLSYSLRRSSRADQSETEGADYRSLLDGPSSGGGGIDLWQYWRALRKRLGIVIAIPIVTVILVGIHEMGLSELYTASSTILIRNSTPQLIQEMGNPVESSAGSSDVSVDPEMFFNTKYELLRTS